MPQLAACGYDAVPLLRGDAASKHGIVAPTDLATLGSSALTGGAPFEVAIHLAALNPDRRDRRSSDLEALRRANRDGTEAFVRASAEAGAKHVIYMSTANVHSTQDGVIDEHSPIAPPSAYARSKADGATVALDRAEACGMRVTIDRKSVV